MASSIFRRKRFIIFFWQVIITNGNLLETVCCNILDGSVHNLMVCERNMGMSCALSTHTHKHTLQPAREKGPSLRELDDDVSEYI